MIHLIWNKKDNQSFRQRYVELTGEKIQPNPQENDTHYIVGSGRLRPEHLEVLQNEFEISTDAAAFVPNDSGRPII